MRRVFTTTLLTGSVIAASVMTVSTQFSVHAASQTCPNSTFTAQSGGWIKTDGLNGTSWAVPQKSGYTVTDICYKAATKVVYPAITGSITSDVYNKPAGEQGRNRQDLSHASVYYTKNGQTPQPAVLGATTDTPSPAATDTTEQPVMIPATGPAGNILRIIAAMTAAFAACYIFTAARRSEK